MSKGTAMKKGLYLKNKDLWDSQPPLSVIPLITRFLRKAAA
jgi:hypothetical protein